MKIRHIFATSAHARGFIAGIEHVNDGAIAVVGEDSGDGVFAVILEDSDAKEEAEIDHRIPGESCSPSEIDSLLEVHGSAMSWCRVIDALSRSEQVVSRDGACPSCGSRELTEYIVTTVDADLNWDEGNLYPFASCPACHERFVLPRER